MGQRRRDRESATITFAPAKRALSIAVYQAPSCKRNTRLQYDCGMAQLTGPPHLGSRRIVGVRSLVHI